MITVSVTEADIYEGRRRDCGRCPVSLAIKPFFPGRGVWVTPGRVVITESEINRLGDDPGDYEGQAAALPKDAKEFVEAFDNSWEVHPIKFDIDLIPEAQPE